MTEYVELHAASAFSFLEGASMPEALIERAGELGHQAIALVDTRGVYGAPRFYQAARKAGVRALVGAEIILEDDAVQNARVVLLVQSRRGYQTLCKLLTASALGRPKGSAKTSLDLLKAHSDDLIGLVGSSALTAPSLFETLRDVWGDRLYVELQRHLILEEERQNQALIHLATRLALPLVATNGVRYARAEEKDIADVFTCLRLHTTFSQAGSRLPPNREFCLKSAQEMLRLFSDLPEAIENTCRIAERLRFTLDDLGYEFPQFPLPEGETPTGHLRTLTWQGAEKRFVPITERVRAQIEKELALIDKLKLAGYFLIVWDIIQFCHQENIMVQGRGSAANSAVCYALSITAVDPIQMELLFERFLSEERGEWPDIDLDLPSGDQREKVIQHLYHKYGKTSSAMTANVITYRSRSAIREVAKVMDYTPAEVDRLSKVLRRAPDEWVTHPTLADQDLRQAGFDPRSPRVQQLLTLWARIIGLPRHLGQHSGGMVMAHTRLDHVVPLEPASMPDRVVIQWDKEDCADLGIIKIDILGLGMLQVLEESLELIQTHEKKTVDLAHLPPDDPLTYELIRRADTVGLFQIESRAQMASLPRHPPKCFYDLVTQVAIIRPGPILGGMMQAYYDRFTGKIPVSYPHPSMESILKRTLGVPLFQEQVLRIAIETAGLSGGEAEQLRRAMGATRSQAKMRALDQRLRQGMAQKGIGPEIQEQVVKMIFGFAAYGFPESHAASFALIAYASAYLKTHHGVAFYTALLNAWPMGFYHPATLIKDAERHGIQTLPIDVNESGVSCRWIDPQTLRLGLRYVQGLSQASAEKIEQRNHPDRFQTIQALQDRCGLSKDELEQLSYAGALGSLDLSRRQALWQSAQISHHPGPLFKDAGLDPTSPLPEMSKPDETWADFQTTHLTTGSHPMCYVRDRLRARHIDSVQELFKKPAGSHVSTAGYVIVRQHPPTAHGFVFLTLEDETGMSQAIITPQRYAVFRSVVVESAALIVSGVLQRDSANVSIRVETVRRLNLPEVIASRDFH